MITLIIADNHPPYLEGLEMLLKKENEIKIITKCNLGSEAISALKRKDSDILLLDLHMPDMIGLEVVEEINKFKPEQKIIILANKKESSYLDKLEKLGIMGYVPNDISLEELIKAIKIVNEGGTYFSEEIQNITKE
ncbi:MAG: hypothetical protein COS14_07615 [Bacteroidetes bacterium CG02_land_8_20_14_3_00_31_25]|nr:response regulator transcription factor [Bacteroidota bacterium]PIV58815.1 MAG: hypothetical protein COS14_07615 [Bacteroidetes bacterium CG02_land_8_20_14_3_00_31_25]PIX35099.1 MAG: hypothetical protein COZ59_06935 [Bacteroidetes bacterium CG_4_8_14_3_um_filter_31_14]PIY02539.1 MAG: hypothetical protein COZ21_13630 [Bacteroidetes bacterium CG_4_10_14_3_um_filter_31_20]